uniref:Serine protease inhibitor n=1 Tax=Haemonchus contortus TaxID=6289 RepID=A0A7I4Y9T7_HAECO|nr:serine protease inhibitor [Haemonchus contortus]CDJ91593.1 Protease inhibitor I8 domain containing protein [Haemonchus contortus]
MTGTVILFVAFVIFTVHAVDPFDCSKDGKCAPGLRCEGGTCVLRTDCPMLSMPRLKSGCTMLTVVDERGCPMPKIVCSKENLKCGAIYCEPGYECDHDTTTCIPRRDCPNLVLPKQEGCTDRMTLDKYDCLVPVRTCKSDKPLRHKRQETATKSSVICPKNAEYRECTNICPAKTCSNFDKVSTCFSLRCGPPACMCKEGHVQLSKDIEQGCVPRETCVKLKSLQKGIDQNQPTDQPTTA